MEVNIGGGLIEVLMTVVVLGGLGYVVLRTVNARRRGEDMGEAAAGALRDVGPPVIVAVLGLVALGVLAALAGVMLLVFLLSALSGDGGQTAELILLWLAGMTVLVVGVVAAVAWGIVRVVRRRSNA